jgi:hypothetical protein
MSKQVTTAEAAEILGISDSAVRQRIMAGTMKGRKNKSGRIMVMLNGNEPAEEKQEARPVDTLEVIGDDMIDLGRRLKKAIKEHDAKVRQEAISEFATTLAETVQKGVK